MSSSSLTCFAWLSIGAAIVTIGLKAAAYLLTGSVGLLSDALESLVNLDAALMALAMLTLAARPPDEEHAYGHSKAEYFASGVEGALIVLAAVSIAWTACPRLLNPQPIEQVGLGFGISVGASLVNLMVARVLVQAGRRYHSITLEADAHHLMTDVWTLVGVLVGIGAVVLTGWERLDSIIALIVALNIVWTGVQLVRRSALGLMDTALLDSERAIVRQILEQYQQQGVRFHALRTRQAGARRFVSVHILVPGAQCRAADVHCFAVNHCFGPGAGQRLEITNLNRGDAFRRRALDDRFCERMLTQALDACSHPQQHFRLARVRSRR